MMNDEYCNHDSEKEDYDCKKSLWKEANELEQS